MKLIVPVTGPLSRPDNKRRELALLGLELCCGLANAPALFDDLEPSERQRWHRLASVSAAVALADPMILRSLDFEDWQALSALRDSEDQAESESEQSFHDEPG